MAITQNYGKSIVSCIYCKKYKEFDDINEARSFLDNNWYKIKIDGADTTICNECMRTDR